MDEQPLLDAIAQTDRDELVGTQRAADGVGDYGPVDKGGDPG